MRVKISPSARHRRSRLIDVTGVALLPGCGGRFCPGNGRHAAADGTPLPCCCDECDYARCCFEEAPDCVHCRDPYCPRAPR